MKNKMTRLFMAVLMVALLVGASIISVSAAEACTGDHDGWIPIYASESSAKEAGAEEGKYLYFSESTTSTGKYLQIGGSGVTSIGDNYYLAENIPTTRYLRTNAPITICLNGKTLDTEGADVYQNGTLRANTETLTLCDCQGSGCIKGQSGRTQTVQIASGVTLTIGDGVTVENGGSTYTVGGSGTLIVTGGTINGTLGHSGGTTITGGTVMGNLGSNVQSITGGTFTRDPSEYVPAGYEVETVQDGETTYYVVKAVAAAEVKLTNEVISAGLEGGTTYYLSDNLTAESLITVSGIKVTLDLKGNTLTAGSALSGGGSFITVTASADLTICDSVGGGAIAGATGNSGLRGILVQSGGTLVLENGTISGFNSGSSGSSAYGGGVQVVSGGAFTMKDGAISGNTAYRGGGVFVAGTFNMEGGIIEKNEISGTSNVRGAGVCVVGGNAVIAGTISKNTNNGSTNVQQGGGIFNGSDGVVMITGTISDNTATYGGGVFKAGGTTELSGGTISDNSATGGGGVYATAGTFTMTGSASITRNEASQGGGIYITGATTAANVKGGTITANSTTKSGGGVYLAGGSTLTLTGSASITGNTATTTGGGVMMAGADTLNLEGADTVISGNTADGGTGVYCYVDGATIKGLGTVSGGVYVYAGTTTISGGNFAGNLNANTDAAFKIDGGKFSAKTSVDKLAAWADTYIAEIWDGSDYVYSYNAEGFYSNGEYMNFESSLALGLNLSKSVGDYTAAVTGGYTVEVDDTIVYAKGIAAKDMDEEITYTITNADGATLFQKTVSIREVAGQWHAAKEYETTMLEDMINYGLAAQTAFGKTSDMTALGDGTDGDQPWTATEATVNGWEDGEVAVSLNLKERIELNVYLKGGITADDIETTEVATVSEENGIFKVTFAEIAVKDVKNPVTLWVAGNEITCSIVDYVVANTTQTDLMTALAKYVDSVSSL